MLTSTIQNVEVKGIVSVAAQEIKYMPGDIKAMAIKVTFVTKKAAETFVENMYNPDVSKNPIIDCGDDWVLLDMQVLRKVELS